MALYLQSLSLPGVVYSYLSCSCGLEFEFFSWLVLTSSPPT